MKFTRVLDDVLGQKSKIKVLRFLTKVGTPFTGRELAHQVGLSPEKTRQVLKDLQEQGIVAEKEMENIENKVIEEFDNRLSLLIWKVREFQRRYKAKDHLLGEIMNEGLVLYGRTIAEVMAGD